MPVYLLAYLSELLFLFWFDFVVVLQIFRTGSIDMVAVDREKSKDNRPFVKLATPRI